MSDLGTFYLFINDLLGKYLPSNIPIDFTIFTYSNNGEECFLVLVDTNYCHDYKGVFLSDYYKKSPISVYFY